MAKHDGAIEYDLLTKTGHELNDVGRTLSWQALASFLLHEEPTSALARELDDEKYIWTQTLKTNGLLADIFDLLAQINANLVAYGNRQPAKEPKRYPRPDMEEKRENERHIGRGALPKAELRKWVERKRQEHGRHD